MSFAKILRRLHHDERGGFPPPAPGAGVTTLAALTDVDVTGVVQGQALIFDGTEWVDSFAVSDGDSTLSYLASDYAARAWTVDPASTNIAGSAFTGNFDRLVLVRCIARQTGSIGSIRFRVMTAHAGAPNPSLKLAVYSSAGVRLGITAELQALLTTTGAKTAAFLASFNVTKGDKPWIGFVAPSSAGGTSAQLAYMGIVPATLNSYLGASDLRTGYVAPYPGDPPASFVPGAMATGAADLYLMAQLIA